MAGSMSRPLLFGIDRQQWSSPRCSAIQSVCSRPYDEQEDSARRCANENSAKHRESGMMTSETASQPQTAHAKASRLENPSRVVIKYLLATATIGVPLLIECTLFTRGSATLASRLSVLFQMLGFYNVGIGFLATSKNLQSLVRLDGMTSANTRAFVASNASVVGMIGYLYSMISRGGYALAQNVPTLMGAAAISMAGGILFFIVMFVIGVLIIVYLLTIMPIAYVGYLVPNLVVSLIKRSDYHFVARKYAPGADVNTDPPIEEVSIAQVVTENEPAVKSFMVGIPAVLLGFFMEALKMLGIQ